MLVLSRRVQETIVIDDQIEVKILQVKGNQIRIGITAPAHVHIRRGELAAHYPASADAPNGTEDSTGALHCDANLKMAEPTGAEPVRLPRTGIVPGSSQPGCAGMELTVQVA